MRTLICSIQSIKLSDGTILKPMSNTHILWIAKDKSEWRVIGYKAERIIK